MERTKEELKAYQNYLRDKVGLKCQSQKVIAVKCKMSNVHFSCWFKGHKELGPTGLKNVELFLEE